MHTKKQIGRVIGIILSLFLLFSLEGRAQEGFTVLEGTAQEGHDYTYKGDVLIVNNSTQITISSNSQETSHRIVVNSGIRAYITLDGVNIRSSGGSPFQIQNGSSVDLKIENKNTLISSGDFAALYCSVSSYLTIDGGGYLTATGGANSAGIGGNRNEAGGTITITSGNVVATGGDYGAGIGGGNQGADFAGSEQEPSGPITISGGSVTAKGGSCGAGIGGGNQGASGNIWINGGRVSATGNDKGAGIGGGDKGAGGNITISGGIVTATGDNGGAGIGNGKDNFDDSSFTTANGNAFIQATSISDRTNEEIWSGVIFEGNTGKVYGNPTLPKSSITIPSGKTLTIDKDKTLTIEKGTTLTNNGVIEVVGTLTNNGVIEVAGTLTNNGTYQGSGELKRLKGGIIKCNNKEAVIITLDANAGDDQVTNLPPTQIIKKETEPTITATPTRENYTLVGWSTTDNGSPITDWSDVTNTDVELFALWKRNTTLEFNANSYSYTYGDNAPTVEATLKVEGENPSSPTETISYSYYKDIDYQLSYIPTDAGTYFVKASYPGDKNNMKAEKIATYTIKQAELTVTPTAGQMIYSDEYPAYTYTGQVGNEKPAFTGDLEVVSQLIGIGNLALVDDIASGFKAGNYKLMLSSADVAITVDSQSSTDAIQAALEAINSSVGTGWHKGPVTLTPTSGFKIKGSSILKSNTEDWKDALTVDGNDGTYEVTYQLKRFRNIAELDAQATPSDEQTLIVQLDKTAPTVAVSTSDLTATVSLSDATSGLASCTYNWDNGGDQSVTLTQGENTKSFTLTGAEGIYPLKVILTDQAGNEATYESQVTLKENRPTPPPTPTPIYYTVSLPAVEGAITDPAAGDHLVESWDSFSFTIALDADYSESVPLVTVDGTVLTPRESDGKYIIKWVRHDMAVEISGIVKNNPTGTDDIQASAVDIRQSAGVLCIDTPQPLEGKIYSAAGTELRTLRLSAGTNRVYGLPQGVCIIRLSDETTRKVIIATH